MQTTGNLGLKKPEGTDIVDIADLNGNMDILDNAVNGKVDKVTGKQLSTNDYTTVEKTKLGGIATGANNYVHPNHTGDVISTGDGVTAIAAGVIVNADINAGAGIDASKIGTGVVSNAEFGYLDGVTSGIQGQLNGKAPLGTTPQQTTADITYYVRTDGNDNNTGLVNTAAGAFRTIGKALSNIPKLVRHNTTIIVAAGTYIEDIIVEGFTCGKLATLSIQGASAVIDTSHKINSCEILNCSGKVEVTGFNALTTSKSAFTAKYSYGFVYSYLSSSPGRANNGFDIQVGNGRIMYSSISNALNWAAIGYYGSVFIQGTSGTGNQTGIFAYIGGIASFGLSMNHTGDYGDQSSQGGMILNQSGVVNPWGDNTTASRSGFSANLSANQSITGSTTTKLLYTTKNWDNLQEYNASLSRFTSKSGGTYLVSASISLLWVPDAARLIMDVFKNGSFHTRLQDITTGQQNDASIAGAAVMGLSSGDYIEIYVYIGGYNVTAFPIGSHFTVLRCA